jgi:3-hydroxyacyl-[acyl-carrier-protein] dehydratase
MASPEEIIADEKTITGYIPQRPPMVMIGKLLRVEEKKIISSFILKEDNIFCENGFFREPGLIENIAQTAAAGTGFKYKSSEKEPPQGFIGGIKNLVILSLPSVHDEIVTEVTIDHKIMNATVITGKTYCHGTMIASCEMKIFLK